MIDGGAVVREQIIRPCRADEADTMLTIVNAAAEAYRGVIPDDCRHDPYMSAEALRSEIAAGVVFTGFEVDGILAGVMGIQRVGTVDLIRHAYVRPEYQGRGVGGAMLERLCGRAERQILVGTWAAATWAVDFYRRYGFRLVPVGTKAGLLLSFWTVSQRQIETSVVLALPELSSKDATMLMGTRRA